MYMKGKVVKFRRVSFSMVVLQKPLILKKTQINGCTVFKRPLDGSDSGD